MSAGKILPKYQVVDGFILPKAFSPQAFRDTVNYKARSGDVFVVTYPKCGTTWSQQILFLITHEGRPPANAMEFMTNVPFLEKTGIDATDNMKPPRTYKIHLPYNLAPQSAEAKYIYMVRNPKDVLVSFFHHTKRKLYDFLDGEFEVFFDLFLDGQVDFMDYFDNVLSWYAHRHDPNVLFMYYEDMKSDIRTEIIKMAAFIGKEYEELLLADNGAILDKVIKYSSLEYMRQPTQIISSEDNLPLPSGMKYYFEYMKKIDCNYKGHNEVHLIRKGMVGGWKNSFSDEQDEKLNKKIKDRLTGTDMLTKWEAIGCLKK